MSNDKSEKGLRIQRTSDGGLRFELPVGDEPQGPSARGTLLRTTNGARFELEGAAGAGVGAEFTKAGNGRLNVLLKGRGAPVSLRFDREKVRSELQRAKAEGKGLPSDLALPANYLAYTKQVSSTPAITSLARRFAQPNVAIPTEQRQLAATTALLSPETFATVRPQIALPISFGDEECDQIGGLTYELCGGGLACLLVAIYYDALCTILSNL